MVLSLSLLRAFWMAEDSASEWSKWLLLEHHTPQRDQFHRAVTGCASANLLVRWKGARPTRSRHAGVGFSHRRKPGQRDADSFEGDRKDEPDFAPLGLRQLPFTPQLSYNPSNDGDTRNPVRPSWNPNFTGPVILGSPNLYFNPAAFTQPSA